MSGAAGGAAPAPEVSVVVSTYNRGHLIGGALRSILDQRGAPPFELVVVDNNSTDDTRAAIEAVAREDARVRYVFEGRQGVSHGRNSGLAAARAPIVAFTDDDVRATPTWVASVARAFAEHPDATYVGGKVHAMWPAAPPAWLTADHWSPLALIDYGERAFEIRPQHFYCVVAANMAVRRDEFLAVGGFDARHQHQPGAVSAIEDHELQLRLLAAGRRGFYVPYLETAAEVQANRLHFRYHARWWFDHGRAVARMTPPGFVFEGGGTMRRASPRAKRVLGVPLYVVRGALVDLRRAGACALRRQPVKARYHVARMLEGLGCAHYHATVRARGRDAGLHAGAPPDALLV